MVIDDRASVAVPPFTPNGMFCVIRFIRRLTTMVLTGALFPVEEDNSVLSVNDIDELFVFTYDFI